MVVVISDRRLSDMSAKILYNGEVTAGEPDDLSAGSFD
jgi:hypothetical protein